MKKDNKFKLSFLTVFLHWLIAIAMIALLSSGIIMKELSIYFIYPIHKSIGVIIVLFVLFRIFWRIKNGWPVPLNEADIYQFIARIIHYILIIGTLLMPISGMIMSAMGGYGIEVFGYEIFPKNYESLESSTIIPINYDISKLASLFHRFLGYLIISALILHILGALKHHFIQKDRTLKRMFGI